MIGLEALSLQGLPIDELLLTRETEDNLADLAGNAMSTTVVGTCIMASLVLARKLLAPGEHAEDAEDAMRLDIDEDNSGRLHGTESHVQGEDKLEFQPLDLSSTSQSSLVDVLSSANRSSRLCECEGRKDITDRAVQRCVDCGSSSCIKCGGRPEHNMEPIIFVDGVSSRLTPSAFEKDLKSLLPMCLVLTNVSTELLDGFWKASGIEDAEDLWIKWRDAVVKATATKFCFIEAKRQDIWVAVYESTSGHLELTLHPQQPEWRLFAKPDESEPANSETRKMLESKPVGRFVCNKDSQSSVQAAGGLLDGRWDFALPFDTRVKITVEGVESQDSLPSLVPSWEANLGLQGDAFRDRVVYSRLRVTVSEEDKSTFDRNIAGIYTLFEKCGTANSALHKKQTEFGEEDLPPLFMLLDPSRCGDPNDDSFVFSISKRRYEYGETRPIICRLDSKWRQTTPVEHHRKVVECCIPFKWMRANNVRLEVSFIPFIGELLLIALKPSHNKDANFAMPKDAFPIDASQHGCKNANAVLACRVALHDQAGPEWSRGVWWEVDKIHERGTFKALAWLLERIRTVDDNFSHWQDVSTPDENNEHIDDRCERCAPTPPQIQWRRVGRKVVAIEDVVGAGEYERSLKRRPTPFVTQLKLEGENGIGTVRIGINIPSLLHRAVVRLPIMMGNGRLEKKPILSWRLRTDFNPAAKMTFPKFNLLSNKTDQEHSQPPSFKIPLRPEQLRSLGWMLMQEDVTRAQPFLEEEISEAIMAPLGWRAEGRARREVLIRGGVLADQVGYGKTAITLGLVDCTQKSIEKKLKADVSEKGEDFIKGKIAVKASLIIVPPHLTGQWASEVKKFTGKRFQVEVLSTATSLNSLTIEKVQDADIVIVASNLFSSSVYLDNLQTLSGGGTLPAQDGRYFASRLDEILQSLKSHVEILRDQGSVSLMQAVKAERRKRT
jgi:SNF2-related domain